jgi:hypothetical protein
MQIGCQKNSPRHKSTISKGTSSVGFLRIYKRKLRMKLEYRVECLSNADALLVVAAC